jgi:aryl-alcohol dehydrogenase-like predicted oxidoreductase
MEYTTLGSTGMEVSRICLACMSFGTSDWREWVLDEEESLDLSDLGIDFFDAGRNLGRRQCRQRGASPALCP